jgi:hypothetical protein
MYRIIVSVFVFTALVLLGAGSQVCAQTINVNNCPNINGTWEFVQEKIIDCDLGTSYPSPTRVSTSGTVTFSQNEYNNCLFSAQKVIGTSTGDPKEGDIVNFTGVIYNGGNKITMQSIIKWDTVPSTGYRIPSSSVFGNLTFNKRSKVGTKITFTGNSHMGLDYDLGLPILQWPPYHCAESSYTVLIPQQ